MLAGGIWEGGGRGWVHAFFFDLGMCLGEEEGEGVGGLEVAVALGVGSSGKGGLVAMVWRGVEGFEIL